MQAAHAVLKRPKSWERHGLKGWIETAAGRLSRMKLAVALAHKLARIAWGVLVGGRNFEVMARSAKFSELVSGDPPSGERKPNIAEPSPRLREE